LFAMFVVLDFSSPLLICCLPMQRLHADAACRRRACSRSSFPHNSPNSIHS
jgi:hypothetical protein